MKVAIDSGHGSDSAGKRTPPLPINIDIDNDGIIDILAGEQFREHYANTGVAFLLDIALRRCHIDTLKVSWNDDNYRDDPNVDLSVRQFQIRAANCDLSVSIHFNAFGDGRDFNSADGLVVYVHSDPAKRNDSMRLSKCIHNHLVKGTQQRDRGILQATFAMCDASAMGTRASVLLELAFMTNLREATTMMASKKFWQEAAEEICQGICDYVGYTYVEPVNQTEEGEEEVRYQRLKDIPEGEFRDIVDDLMTAGFIKGDGSDKKGNNDIIDISHDNLRMLVWNYRAGIYDKCLLEHNIKPRH
jgi:N-acetylmuramoyl-L-alanine amidase